MRALRALLVATDPPNGMYFYALFVCGYPLYFLSTNFTCASVCVFCTGPCVRGTMTMWIRVIQCSMLQFHYLFIKRQSFNKQKSHNLEVVQQPQRMLSSDGLEKRVIQAFFITSIMPRDISS